MSIKSNNNDSRRDEDREETVIASSRLTAQCAAGPAWRDVSDILSPAAIHLLVQ